MKYPPFGRLTRRLIGIVVAVLLVSSCDLNDHSSSLSIGPSTTRLSAPAALARAVDVSALYAQITLSYTVNSQPFSRSIVVGRDAASSTWDAELDIPPYTLFTLEITWFDTEDVERLDLTRLSRSFRTSDPGSSATLTFNFDEYDDAQFNADADSFTNLEERINGTSPFFNDSSVPAETDANVAIRFAGNVSNTITTVATGLDSSPVVAARWTPLENNSQLNTVSCAEVSGFDEALAADSLAEACTLADDCVITFSDPIPSSQAGNANDFTVDVPSLKAPVGVAYELQITNTSQQTSTEQYTFCLVAINSAPVTGNDAFAVTAGVPFIIDASQSANLLSNDVDDLFVGNVPLFIDTTPVRAPALATSFELRSDGGFSYLYDPAGSNTVPENLTDSFEYAVSDGTFISTATVTLQIVLEDQPPVLVSAIPAQRLFTGIPVSLDLSLYFNDPENSELSYRAEAGTLNLLDGLELSNTGILSGAAQAGDEGTYDVQIVASDQTSSVIGTLAIEVVENQPPLAGPIADIGELNAGEPVSVDAGQSFSDPEGAALTFTLQSSPDSGLQINSSTGLVSGQIANAGTYTLTVSASDGITPPVSSSFSATQLPDSSGTATLSAPTPDTVNLSAQLRAQATGSFSFANLGNADLDFTVASDQEWLTASTTRGVLTSGADGSVTVTGQCADSVESRTGNINIGGNGGSASVAVTLTCDAIPSAPLDDAASVSVNGIAGSYFLGTPPADNNALALDALEVDGSVIRGGSIAIPIAAQSTFSSVYVVANNANETAVGYWQVLLPDPALNGTMLVNYKLDIPQGSDQLVAVQVGDSDGAVSNVSEVSLQTELVGTGDLQVSVSWDKESDVDLILVEPVQKGETPTAIDQRNPLSNFGGTLDLDSNRFCVIDGIKNENITYVSNEQGSGIPPNGQYTVFVLYFDDCNVGSSNYVLTIRYDGVVTTYTGTLQTTGEIQTKTFEINRPAD